MDDTKRKAVLDEARANIANKTPQRDPSPRSIDPLARWCAEAAQLDSQAEQGRRELKAEEERIAREAQQCSPQAWDAWFIAQLQNHLLTLLEPTLNGIAEGVAQLCGELHAQLKAQRDDIRSLQMECATLAARIAEMRTDRVLNAIPLASTDRVVN